MNDRTISRSIDHKYMAVMPENFFGMAVFLLYVSYKEKAFGGCTLRA